MSQSKPLLYLKKHYCTVCGNIYEDEKKKIGIFFVPKNKFVSWLEKFLNSKRHRDCVTVTLTKQILSKVLQLVRIFIPQKDGD